MFQPKHQLSIQTNALSIQDSSALVQVEQKDTSVVAGESMQNGGASQSDPIIYYSKKLQDELHALGQKIKEHEENLKLLNTQRNKLDDSLLDLQVTLGKFHASSASIENDHSDLQSEEATTEQILRHEKSAAGVLCQLKTRHGAQALHLPLTKDVLGIVASLGKVGDENLSRLFSEYLGVDTMLAIVCNTNDGVKALETYDDKGCIIKSSGLHGLGASIGRAIDGRFTVICLENLRPFAGDFVADDPQRQLDLLTPRLANGEIPSGFLGFAVNMINIDTTNLFHVTAHGYGLRETLFYNLFFRLQVYKTRAEMLLALPLITDGAVSLDGGMIRNTGVFSLGSRQGVDVIFPKSSGISDIDDKNAEIEKQIQETKWQKEKIQADTKREISLLNKARATFATKKAEFLKFLAQSSSYASQNQMQSGQDRMTPR